MGELLFRRGSGIGTGGIPSCVPLVGEPLLVAFLVCDSAVVGRI